MAKIVTVEQMREIESAADAAGHSYGKMMQLAGTAVANAVLALIDEAAGKSILVLAGVGNNGGDALVAADQLAEAGCQVAVYLTKERGEDDPLIAALRQRGMLIAAAEQDQRSRVLKLQLGKAEVIVDGVLGTGTQLPLRGAAQEVIKAAKSVLEQRDEQPIVVAVDCPSGIDCDSGEASPETLQADLTLTLAAAKIGLLRFPAAALAGELSVADIGIPAEDLRHIQVELATADGVARLVPERPPQAHKGTFGRVMVIAGSRNYPGAALLAAEAAYLSGAGLVTCAVPESVQPMLVARLPEATWIPLPETDGWIGAGALELIEPELPSTTAVLLGPGLGLSDATARFVESLLGHATELPAMVVDADGLKQLAKIEAWHERLPAAAILTPHPGEMSVLTGRSTTQIQDDRLASAQQWAKTWGHVVVLKGAHTVIADPAGGATVLPFATPALARAGTGDVLAGVLAGLRAQGMGPSEAAVLGGYLHGRAGVLAADELGSTASVVASDVASMLSQVFWELETGEAAE